MKRLLNPPFDLIWALMAGPTILFSLIAISNSAPLLKTHSGMLLLTICATIVDSEFDKTPILVSPDFIAAISKPVEAREECVKVLSPSGRGLYVYGTLDGVAEMRAKAMRDYR